MYRYIILWVWMCHSVISSVRSFAVRRYTQWDSSFTEYHKFLVQVHLEFESSCEERKKKKQQGIFTPLNVILPILTRTNISFWNNSPLESVYLSYYSDISSSLHVCNSLSLSFCMFLRYHLYLLPPLLQVSLVLSLIICLAYVTREYH